ncbi:phenylacetic acid degradation bifunctional protein PaaZ [Alteraurantiacibacter buctensis]|uniref:Phenylacetic acid degradation bifunctional protein PaaZ n=1 Tax=Alteraurantiacibacter buctensis TaxID=1503981 RepID=A0A844Z0H4_9SPHN|nr:phenylacetic acid degradation bifunctional protein PaaZ [Alteraurantiacibacter buctensis]MXO73002.1 phenylacetic acid degradation bifunctional protein PaaZ [Alteraurantiacibacter buctensis]
MTQPIALRSYAQDRFLPAGEEAQLVSAIDGSTVALMPSEADPGAMLQHAREVGGPALRAMTFQQRGKMLRALADALTARKDELYALSAFTGATRSDSAFDIEGGIGTLFVYSSKAKGLPDARVMTDGARETISKGDFIGQHILAPLRGAAIHINAYNFPVWGMLEKLAPTLLAGMPAIVKPGTVGAYLTEAAFRIMIESGALPPGAVQLLLGSAGDLLDRLDGQDSVAFTGSAATANMLKARRNIIARTVRFSAEQDSLNAAILGPDASPEAPEFDLFIKEVVREMTQKAGQKCTAIRRVLVPAHLIDQVQGAVVARLGKATIGDPRSDTTRLGALAGIAQREDVMSNLATLRTEAELVTGGIIPQLGGELDKGAFFAATLLRCDRPAVAKAVHAVEAFGPVATLMPYADAQEAIVLANAGEGSLALSIFSNDAAAINDLVGGVSSFHGRIMIVDRDNAEFATGHGAALPHLQHGGPGRAGGGAELGGIIGMMPYLQRSAIQASDRILTAIGGM